MLFIEVVDVLYCSESTSASFHDVGNLEDCCVGRALSLRFCFFSGIAVESSNIFSVMVMR